MATQTLAFLRPGNVRVIWKRDRLGRPLPHLIEIIIGLKAAGVGFCALIEQRDQAAKGAGRGKTGGSPGGAGAWDE